MSASLRPSMWVQRDKGNWSPPAADQLDFFPATQKKQEAGGREGDAGREPPERTEHIQPHTAGGHGVAAPCPWAQSTPLPSQSQTSWARWRTATAGSEWWTPQRGASDPRWEPTGSRRSRSPVCSISSRRTISSSRLTSTTITIITTTTTCPRPLLHHPPPPLHQARPAQQQQPLWLPAGPTTCPTGYRSSPEPSEGSATAASGTSETCRPTRRRWEAEGRQRRRGTATRSPDTRQVRASPARRDEPELDWSDC